MNLIRDDSAVRAARHRVALAKQQWSEAARASLRKEPDAALKANIALQELNDAREALRAIEVHR